MRPGGTDLDAALEAALDAFDIRDEEPAGGRAIVVFSDGEDLTAAGGPRGPTLDRLRGAGVLVHAVAIGDAERGHPVPVGGRPLTYRGREVRSRRDDRPLRALCRATGGVFVPLGLAWTDLGELFRVRIAPVARRRREAARTPERVERFGVLVLAALAASAAASWPGTRRAAVLALLPLVGAGPRGETAAEAVAAGNAAFAAGNPRGALTAFERAVVLDPRSAVPRYNAAAALFRLGRYEAAAARYREARQVADAGLRTKVDFALGNVAVALGDFRAALRHYDDCLGSDAPGAASRAVRADARVNRAFAARRVPPPPHRDDGEGHSAARETARPAAKPDQDAASSTPGSAPTSGTGGASRPTGPPGTRRVGGAAGTNPTASRPASPEGQLAAALENIREARRRRPTDESPSALDEEKDW